MKLNKTEALRYLGVYKAEPDSATDALIEQVYGEISKKISPKCVYKKYDIKVIDKTVAIAGQTIASERLANHLAGCDFAYLFAATLGIGADNAVRTYSTGQMSKTAAAQAVCAALIEDYCDEMQEIIAKTEREAGYLLRSRFSPGYGDFSLGFQKPLLNLLSAAKTVGITLTDGLLMIPTKSVTAVIGAVKAD